MKSVRVEEQNCPHCGHPIDMHSSKDAEPKPGDLSICFYCGEFILFSEHMSLLKCPQEYLDVLDEETREELHRVQEDVKQIING